MRRRLLQRFHDLHAVPVADAQSVALQGFLLRCLDITFATPRVVSVYEPPLMLAFCRPFQVALSEVQIL